MENISTDIYNAIDDIVLVINEDYGIELVNRKGKEVFHLKEEQIINNKCYELICKNEKPRGDCPLLCIKKNRIPEQQFYIEQNGHIYQGTCTQLTHNNGKPAQYIDIFHDVTDLVKKQRKHQEKSQEYEAINEEYLSSIEELQEKNEIILEEKQKFEQLFTNMNSAFALHEIILDKSQEPCDYRFLECNPMFEKQTGLKASQIIGKTVLEVMPGTEKYWIETYGKVALGGQPIRFTNYAKELGKYFETYSYSPRKGIFAVTFNDITSRVDSQKTVEAKNKELKETLDIVTGKEQLLQTIFNSSPSVMLLLDENTEIIQINHAGLEQTEKKSDEVIGLRSGNVFKCLNAISSPLGCGFGENCKECVIRNTVEHTLKTGIPMQKLEAELQKLDKEDKLEKQTFLVSTRVVNNMGKTNILVILDDITDRKKKEVSLRNATLKALENKAKFEAAFMTSPDSININAIDGTYVDVNNGFIALTGFTRNDVIGKKSSEFNIWAIPEDRDKLLEALNKYGKIENLESVFRCKDGSLKTALMSANIIKINDEPHILSITRDISDKKVNDEKLKVESAIAEAFATTDNNIVFHNVLETLLEFFQCEYGLFGYIDETGNLVCPSMTYKIWDKCKMPDKTIIFPKEKWAGIWGESLQTKKSIIKNSDLKVPEGHIKLKNALSVAIADKSELAGIIVIGNKAGDFTGADKSHLEEFCHYISPLLKACLKELNYKEEILKAKENAEKADRLKSTFLANMSHEIRTPLNGIMGFTDLITNQKDLSEEQKSRYASIITKSSESLIQIVDDILDISSLESGNFSLFKRLFNLNDSIVELYNLFAKKIIENDKSIKLSHKISNEKIIINNDETRFRQVFSNLIENAIKFTQNGNIEFGISEITDKKIVFFVSDTGIGIPEDKFDIIFDRFRQGEETSTRVYGGNGLGLSIVKELVRLMGGEIWLESILEKGTTFYFTLPKSNSPDFVETKPKINFNTENSEINVLIVEDDQFNAEYLEEIMNSINSKYTVCRDGQSAINSAKSGNFDILLLDIQLPDINGLNVAREIRKFNKKIKIIAQTAYAMHSDEIEAISAGCNGYVSKPIKKNVLLEKIKAFTNSQE